jgi:hypothetical protein
MNELERRMEGIAVARERSQPLSIVPGGMRTLDGSGPGGRPLRVIPCVTREGGRGGRWEDAEGSYDSGLTVKLEFSGVGGEDRAVAGPSVFRV